MQIRFSISTFSLLLCLTVNMLGQEADTVDGRLYVPVTTESAYEWTYKMGDMTFVDHYLTEQVKVGDHKYAARVRQYSNGVSDTTLYRNGVSGVHHMNIGNDSSTESLTVPVKAAVGVRWLEWNSSWIYEIVSLDDKIGEYDSLMVVRSTQLIGDDQEVGREFDLYFKRGMGLLATKFQGSIINYLSQLRRPVIADGSSAE